MSNMSYTDRGIELALDGAVKLIEWEFENKAVFRDMPGLLRAIEIVKNLKARLLKDVIECVEQ